MPAALSPSAERICQAAILHFSEHHYDGASLNEIAAAAGIRKASLYAHFKSKDELYLAAFNRALAVELEHVQHCFSHSDTAPLGMQYCQSLQERYIKAPTLRFMLLAAYLQPASLKAALDEGYEDYLQLLNDRFRETLLAAHPALATHTRAITQFSSAYLGIVDSLHVKLVYTNGQEFQGRLSALEMLLTTSLQHTLHTL
ncbi:TetR/AcrR family transcriptional regulator [Paenalcaligenes sp. Me131]|uniref:TetR/AcrR family transcriptional regulator n=1 Tax=Paenalcaligenes sp. Me131 TaxID=3392636 RepID=UPI003D2B3BF1